MAFKDTWKDKTQGQDYVNAEDINSIAKEVISIVEDSKKIDHAKLKNLGFVESGHTGFQSALTEEQLKNIEKVSDIEENLNASIEHIDSVAEKVDASEKSISEIKSTAYRLIRRLTVEEDVASVAISKDEEDNPFKLTDFEVRFSGSATTTQWYSIGQGEKYSSLNGTLNNGGLPFWNAGGYKNTYVKYVYSDANYYGFAFEQIHTSSASAGAIKPFDTTKCSKATSVIVQAISGGVLNSGSVIEVWGY